MSIFRSELMVRKKIRIPRINANEIMNVLGNLHDSIEFIDLTKEDMEAKKNFIQQIKRCEEVEKKINNFEKICEKYQETIFPYKKFSDFLNDLENDNKRRSGRGTYFDLIEAEIYEDERRNNELMTSLEQIAENLDFIIEKKAVYDKCVQLLESPEMRTSGVTLSSLEESGTGANFLAGTIKAEDELRMKRMIFRISRGRAIPSFFNFDSSDNLLLSATSRKIFTIFYQGSAENVLQQKLIKILDLFNASRYLVPPRNQIDNEITKLKQEIRENREVYRQAETSIRNYIKEKTGDERQASIYEMYRIYFKKEKLIFSNLNKCYVHDNFIDGEVWIPLEKFPEVQSFLNELTKGNEKLPAKFYDIPDKTLNPPTYIKTNEFTWAFQEIVNTYGIPRYREINPALFNIVTFPFLFGIMFGDIGHGFLLFLFGLYLCIYKNDLVKGESALKPAVRARYLLVMMGFFAFFNGWMYNDFLSMPLGVFGTCYENQGEIAVRNDENCVYPIGIDPKWYVSSNELAFFNSLKMKISVIFGVTQMLFGIILRGLNAVHFNSKIDFFFEFIPQIIFMSLLFGYMIVMIFIKWSVNWFSIGTDKAPSIITQLMNIFLAMGKVGDTPLWGSEGSQESFHFYVLIIAVICIPLLLFPKPLIMYFSQGKHEHESKPHSSYQVLNEEVMQEYVSEAIYELKQGKDHHEEPLSELFVHQAIETIEFVLGSISNTASYLRLWALSLAHAQLAKVFFEKSLLGFIHEGSIIGLIIGFFIFANVTFFVLMCMDLMECFLHTLRLHWVEFQNKFYKADGYKFNPFVFKTIVENDDN